MTRRKHTRGAALFSWLGSQIRRGLRSASVTRLPATPSHALLGLPPPLWRVLSELLGRRVVPFRCRWPRRSAQRNADARLFG